MNKLDTDIKYTIIKRLFDHEGINNAERDEVLRILIKEHNTQIDTNQAILNLMREVVASQVHNVGMTEVKRLMAKIGNIEEL